jgi:succinyl-diaminopimelate desuccinylase
MQQEIASLASALIQIPSRAGIDASAPILSFLEKWMEQHGLETQPIVTLEGKKAGTFLHLRSGIPGPVLCLNACLDTAPFGDESAWQHSPTSGMILDGRLYGRGAADSKIAVSIFSHLAAKLVRTGGLERGELFVVFDADEHSGEFTGIKRFLEIAPARPEAVLIGYPGNQNLVIGSRGFLRAVIQVFGVAAHSGSRSRRGSNAIQKMAHLVEALYARELPKEAHPDFCFGAEMNVTEIQGGEGFSVIPDLCTCKVDLRLTPQVDRASAAGWLESIVRGVDLIFPGQRESEISWLESWPAYCVSRESYLVNEFLRVVEVVFGRPAQPVVSGPSNIGNFLASKGIPALAGFGVTYGNLHGTDEYCEVDTIAPVFETYWQVAKNLTTAGKPLDGGILVGM